VTEQFPEMLISRFLLAIHRRQGLAGITGLEHFQEWHGDSSLADLSGGAVLKDVSLW